MARLEVGFKHRRASMTLEVELKTEELLGLEVGLKKQRSWLDSSRVYTQSAGYE